MNREEYFYTGTKIDTDSEDENYDNYFGK